MGDKNLQPKTEQELDQVSGGVLDLRKSTEKPMVEPISTEDIAGRSMPLTPPP